ncbi:uncharacterized protein NPIL_80761 [Nephila pilipes]|uniref:Uncharacterized protein n=1 Tax=Nephila pilipes TaxID=299642 RepID=A0A8X6JLX6_NEPPI|nr:uncharacterized protein NPIL_80761 [Nephila pilipes]
MPSRKPRLFVFCAWLQNFVTALSIQGEVAGQPISFHGYGQKPFLPPYGFQPPLILNTQNSIAVFINVYDSFGYAWLERWGQRTGTDWEPSFREKGTGQGVLKGWGERDRNYPSKVT